MRSVTLVLALCGLLLVCSGCGPMGINAVRMGMMPFDVEEVMAREPMRIIRGKGVDLDKETHVYPSGRVHFFKKRVVHVQKDQQGGTITEKAGRLQDEERNP